MNKIKVITNCAVVLVGGLAIGSWVLNNIRKKKVDETDDVIVKENEIAN